jgi:hypothetical protein
LKIYKNKNKNNLFATRFSPSALLVFFLDSLPLPSRSPLVLLLLWFESDMGSGGTVAEEPPGERHGERGTTERARGGDLGEGG